MFNPKDLYQKTFARDDASRGSSFKGFPDTGVEAYYETTNIDAPQESQYENPARHHLMLGTDESQNLRSKIDEPVVERPVLDSGRFQRPDFKDF